MSPDMFDAPARVLRWLVLVAVVACIVAAIALGWSAGVVAAGLDTRARCLAEHTTPTVPAHCLELDR